MASSPSRKMCAPFGPSPGLLVPSVDERRRVGVADLHLAGSAAAAGDAPDLAIAVAGHVIEHFHFALQDLVVGRQHVCLVLHRAGIDVARIALDERQERAIAEGREAVCGAIAR